MLNFRFTGKSSDLPPIRPVDEDLGGMYERVFKGGPGSGNWGHAGRPGEVGGSAAEGGGGSPAPDAGKVRENLKSMGIAQAYATAQDSSHGTELSKEEIDRLETQILNDKLDSKPGMREAYNKHVAELTKLREGEMPGYKNGFKGETRFKNSAIPGRDATEEGVGFTKERADENRAYVLASVDRMSEAAKPGPGQRPTFTNLAGRGGSGKGKLEDIEYDSEKSVVVNADDVKMWRMAKDGHADQGHLAPLYHEESSQIAEQIMEEARARKLNVVYDATMKSDKPNIPGDFSKEGYDIHTIMVQVGGEEAAGRAVDRYINGTKDGKVGRLVPPSIVLGNINNEANFDREVARRNGPGDQFSLYDNRGGTKDTQPRLIANEKGEGTHGAAAVAAAAAMRERVLREDAAKSRKVDNSIEYGILREKGVVDMTRKADNRTREEAWADAQDYPDMPDGSLPEELVFEGFREAKHLPEDIHNVATEGRLAGRRERYRAWLKDHPFDS